jgi:hypothetical protein
MPNRIVLIPFPEAASFEHLLSTQGGNALPELEDTLLQAKAQYKQAVNKFSKHSIPTNPAVLKSSSNPILQKAGEALELAKVNYDMAKANRNTRGWKKIDPQDVVCRDSPLLTAALAKLKTTNDTLFIRGHSSAGADLLWSSDRSEKISVNDLVKFLKGKLDKKFPGTIKIFACKSSQDTVDSNSFAKKFAIALSNAGWINCEFYGFSENLKTYVDQNSGRKITEAGTARVFIQVPTKHTCCIIS